MPEGRRSRLVGKTALIVHRTTHYDRAGQTGSQVETLGEIVMLDARGWAVVATEAGFHLRCPASKLYRAPAAGCRTATSRGVVHPDYVALEELSRDFFSGTLTRPATLRWLDRRAVLEAVASSP